MITQSDREGRFQDDHVFESRRARPSRPFMPVFAPPQVMFVRGKGTELLDIDGKPLPRLPVGHRRHVARPRQPGGRRGDRRPRPASCSTSATSSPTPWRRRRRWRSTELLGEATGAAGPGVLHQLRRRGRSSARSSWPASTAAAAATSSSAPSAASTAAPSPRSPPPASRPSTSRSSRCPRASSHVAWGDVDALAGRGRRHGRRRADRADPGRGRGATRRPPGYLAAIRDASATRPGR